MMSAGPTSSDTKDTTPFFVPEQNTSTRNQSKAAYHQHKNHWEIRNQLAVACGGYHIAFPELNVLQITLILDKHCFVMLEVIQVKVLGLFIS